MASNRKDVRNTAEAKFAKAQKTTVEAKAVTDSDLQLARKKTAKLREQRLAKEAAESAAAELEKAPAVAKKRKVTSRT